MVRAARPTEIPGQRRGSERAALCLCAAIFVADVALPPEVATDALYVVPVFVALWSSGRRAIWRVAATSTALSVAACFAPEIAFGSALGEAAWWSPEMLWLALPNRAISLFAIWAAGWTGALHRRAEEELAESREIARATLAGIADAVVQCDSDGRVTFLNGPAERLTGWMLDEARGKPIDEVVRFTPARDGGAGPQEGRLAGRGRSAPVELSRARIASTHGEHGEVAVLRDLAERLRAEETIRRLAYRDELTGLPNRNALADRFAVELARARRTHAALAVIFVDLDGLKGVNDRHGHGAGDALLVAAAERMRGVLRETDLVARLGGDEFALLLPEIAGAGAAHAVAAKVLEALSRPLVVRGEVLRPCASLGLALWPEDGADADALLAAADRAMYRAKAAGGGRVVAAAAPAAAPHEHGAPRGLEVP
jgi:diguanylate cyclase (GGDEF)-like protein/PAS domain S-box-containing protein